jgi:hypothetical protein
MAAAAHCSVDDPLSSFRLLDACRLPTVLQHGRLLMRGDDDDHVALRGGRLSTGPAPAQQWRQAFVVLTERALYWLLPPAARWHAVELTHAVVGMASGAAAATASSAVGAPQEVFELSTARVTLKFRCRNAAAAARWAALLRAACEHQSDNALLEVPDAMTTDYLESRHQQPLLTRVAAAAGLPGVAAASGSVPNATACSDAEVGALLAGRVPRLTTAAAAEREAALAAAAAGGVSPLAAAGGGGGGRGAGLLPPPRGRFDVPRAVIPPEGVLAGAVHVLRQPEDEAAVAAVLRATARAAAAAAAAPSSAGNGTVAGSAQVSTTPARRRPLLPPSHQQLLLPSTPTPPAELSGSGASPFVAHVPRALLAPALFSPTAAAAAAARAAAGGGGSDGPAPQPTLPAGLIGPGATLLEAAALAGCSPEHIARVIDAAATRAAGRDALSRRQARVPSSSSSSSPRYLPGSTLQPQATLAAIDPRLLAATSARYGGSGGGPSFYQQLQAGGGSSMNLTTAAGSGGGSSSVGGLGAMSSPVPIGRASGGGSRASKLGSGSSGHPSLLVVPGDGGAASSLGRTPGVGSISGSMLRVQHMQQQFTMGPPSPAAGSSGSDDGSPPAVAAQAADAGATAVLPAGEPASSTDGSTHPPSRSFRGSFAAADGGGALPPSSSLAALAGLPRGSFRATGGSFLVQQQQSTSSSFTSSAVMMVSPGPAQRHSTLVGRYGGGAAGSGGGGSTARMPRPPAGDQQFDDAAARRPSMSALMTHAAATATATAGGGGGGAVGGRQLHVQQQPVEAPPPSSATASTAVAAATLGSHAASAPAATLPASSAPPATPAPPPSSAAKSKTGGSGLLSGSPLGRLFGGGKKQQQQRAEPALEEASPPPPPQPPLPRSVASASTPSTRTVKALVLAAASDGSVPDAAAGVPAGDGAGAPSRPPSLRMTGGSASAAARDFPVPGRLSDDGRVAGGVLTRS